MKEIRTKKNRIQILTILCLTVVFTVLMYSRQKTFTLVVDGQSTKYTTFSSTVGKALEKENIVLDKKDKIGKPLDSKIAKNDVITIKKAVPVKIELDGKVLDIKSSEENIDSMLKAEGININTQDKISPSTDAKLYSDMKVSIVRVDTRTVTDVIAIDFNTVVQNDSNMPATQNKVIQEGEKGEKQTTYSVVYEDGKEVSRKLISEKVSKAPKSKVVAQGTLKPLPVNRGGDPVYYTKTIKVKATAYYAIHGIGTTYTASGRKAVRDPNGYSTIAVDPRVIPLGTRVYVEGYGLAIAADVGTAVKGNFVDVYFNTYNEACNWAVKYVNVYVLK